MLYIGMGPGKHLSLIWLEKSLEQNSVWENQVEGKTLPVHTQYGCFLPIAISRIKD